jgi:hypothetical protein
MQVGGSITTTTPGVPSHQFTTPVQHSFMFKTFYIIGRLSDILFFCIFLIENSKQNYYERQISRSVPVKTDLAV